MFERHGHALWGSAARTAPALLAALCCLVLAAVGVQPAAARTLQATVDGWLPVDNANEFLTALSASTTQHIQLRQHLSTTEVAAAMLSRTNTTDLRVFAPVPTSLASISVRCRLDERSRFACCCQSLLHRLHLAVRKAAEVMRADRSFVPCASEQTASGQPESLRAVDTLVC